jgi:cytochrome P450
MTELAAADPSAPIVHLGLAWPVSIQDPHGVFDRALSVGTLGFDPDLGGYVVGQYDTVRDVLRREADFGQHAEFHEKMIGARDFLGMADPDHAEVRAVFAPAFTPPAVRALEDATRQIVREALDRCAELNTAEGGFDLVAAIARPVAGGTLAALLGVPPDDTIQFMQWADSIGKTTEALAQRDPDERARLERIGSDATKLLLDYAETLLRARSGDAGDNEANFDLVAAFAHSMVARQMSDAERQANIARIILGGHDNTWKLISHLLVELLRRPDYWERLRADPGLISPAVEEVLRYVTSAPVIQRVARTPQRIGDYEVPAGAHVFVVLGAANHDPARFERPHEFDIDRPRVAHLDFGLGPHVCIGGSTTRMELRVVLEEMLLRFPQARLDQDEIQYGPIFMSRGPMAARLVA